MVKEYIEREAARLAYESSLKNDTHRTEEASRIHAQEHRHMLHVLDKIPAADVVEVVRCRDCKHENVHHAISDKCTWCDYWGIDPDFDDFCSCGEKRGSMWSD